MGYYKNAQIAQKENTPDQESVSEDILAFLFESRKEDK